MRSVRGKLFLFLMVSLAAAVGLGVLLNVVFLEGYYISENRRAFLSAKEEIASEYERNPAGIATLLQEVDRTLGISGLISDRDAYILESSFQSSRETDLLKLPAELEQLVRSHPEVMEGRDLYTTVETPGYRVREIALVSGLSGGDVLILRKPVTWVVESTRIANRFLLFTGLLVLLLGGIAGFLLARRVTRPIVRMSQVAEGMSRLEFDQRIDSRSRDEIGDLGRSIDRIADRLSASLEALQRDVDRRKALVRNLSHELKTPIGVIKGYAEGLEYGIADDPEKIGRYCGVIADECDRMDGLVREMLDLSRLESGTFRMERTRFQAADLVRSAADRFQPEILAAGVVLSVDCEDGIVLEADRALMDRLLGNLLSNAIRHAQGGKRVVVKARRQDGRFRLSVENSGAPVGEADLERIWDVFYKADKARTREDRGHGLGLSIVKGIVDLHGGTCSCRNLSDGVEFAVEVPFS